MMWMCHLCFPPVETTHLLLHIELQLQYPLQFILFVKCTKVIQISTQLFVALVMLMLPVVVVYCLLHFLHPRRFRKVHRCPSNSREQSWKGCLNMPLSPPVRFFVKVVETTKWEQIWLGHRTVRGSYELILKTSSITSSLMTPAVSTFRSCFIASARNLILKNTLTKKQKAILQTLSVVFSPSFSISHCAQFLISCVIWASRLTNRKYEQHVYAIVKIAAKCSKECQYT